MENFERSQLISQFTKLKNSSIEELSAYKRECFSLGKCAQDYTLLGRHQQENLQIDTEILSEIDDFLDHVRAAIKCEVHSVESNLSQNPSGILTKHFAGGKFVRPQALFLLARALGCKDNDYLIQIATALELVHRSTLLVDDIADNSSLRNAKPTVHGCLGASTTTFLSHSFSARGVSLCPPFLISDLLLSIEELNIGQTGENLWPYDFSSPEAAFKCYNKVVLLKSGSLGRFCLLAATKSSKLHDINLLALNRIANNLALAYQIANDLSDLSSWLIDPNAEIPNDVRNHTPSYPLLLARVLGKHSNNIYGRCIYEGGETIRLKQLLITSEIFQHCNEKIMLFIKNTIHSIHSCWPANPYSFAFVKLSCNDWLRAYLGPAISLVDNTDEEKKEKT